MGSSMTDAWGANLFLVYSVVALGFVIYGLAAADWSPNHLIDKMLTCSRGSGRQLSHKSRSTDGAGDTSFVAAHLWIACVMVPALVVVVLIWMQLLKKFASRTVYGVCMLVPCLLVVSAVLTAVGSGNGLGVISCLSLAVLWCLLTWCKRSKLVMTIALLEQAAVLLTRTPTLLFTTFALFVPLALILTLSIIAMIALFPMFIGYIGDDCAFHVPAAAEFGQKVVLIFAIWLTALVCQARLFIVASVTRAWYFLQQPGAHPVCSALNLILCRSFGTIAVSSLITTIVNLLQMGEKSTNHAKSTVCKLAGSCFGCILECVRYLNDYALVMHAITGKPFCKSASDLQATLTKHGLSGLLFVDFMSSVVVRVTALSIGLLTGSAIMLISRSLQGSTVGDASLALVLAIACLTVDFLAATLLDIVSTVYVCVLIDLDSGAPHQPVLSDLFISIVKPGSVPTAQVPPVALNLHDQQVSSSSSSSRVHSPAASASSGHYSFPWARYKCTPNSPMTGQHVSGTGQASAQINPDDIPFF